MKLVIDTPRIRAYEGNAEDWNGGEHIDLVFTNPYGYLPASLVKHPMIIHQWVRRHREAEEWCGNILSDILSVWNNGQEAFWSANIRDADRVGVNLSRFKPEPGGWYPEDLVREVIARYAMPGQTVWDGFMGRGTIAKICMEYDVNYVGVEQLPAHVALAKTYLGISE